MTTLTAKQNEIAELLKKRFDYISKMDALKFVKSIYGSFAEIKDILAAYNSIEIYNY